MSMEAEHFTRAVAPRGALAAHPGPRPHALGDDAVAGHRAGADAGRRLAAAGVPDDLFASGQVKVHAYLSPTLDVTGGEGLRYAVSIDDEPPQIVNPHADG